MPRPRSKNTQAALDDIAAGMRQCDAAKKHGVDQSVISRMLKPKEITVNVKLTKSDILDWLQLYGELYDKLEIAMKKLQDKKS